MRIEQSFTELSARERAFALLDAGSARELLGPFAHLKSPHLLGQGIVAQNDDGMIVVRGAFRGADAVVIAMEGKFQGGGIGEIAGAKFAAALELVLAENQVGRKVQPIIVMDTGGVRLQDCLLYTSRLPPVAGHGPPEQVAVPDQPVHVDGDEVRLAAPDIDDVPGRAAVRVVGQEEQNVEGRLGQPQLLTERAAQRAVGQGRLPREGHAWVHGITSITSKMNHSTMKDYSGPCIVCQPPVLGGKRRLAFGGAA